MRLKRRLWVYGLATAILVVALAAFLGPALIDTPAVRAEIQRRLAEALQGQVTWQSLEVALLPAPHAELRRVRLEIPGKVGAAADELNIYLRLWPLLQGRAEVSSLTVKQPVIRLHSGEAGNKAPLDAVAAYRAAVEPAVRALQEFAPDMVLRVDQGQIHPFSKVDFSARTGSSGVALELSAAAPFWKRLSIDGRIDYADLSARARVEVDGLVADPDLPPGRVRAQVRTDAKTAVEGEFDGNLGPLASAKGRLTLPAGKAPLLAAEVSQLDVAQAIAVARRKTTGLDVIESAEGRLSAKVEFELADAWKLRLDVVKSDATVKLQPLPWKISAQAAQLLVTPEGVRVVNARGAVGDSTFENAMADVELGKQPRLSAASAKAAVPLEQWLPWLRDKAPLEDIDAIAGTVDVSLERLALRFERPQDAEFDVVVAPRKVTAVLKPLPAPLSVDGGSVRVNHTQVRLERVGASILDARALVSGTVELANGAIALAINDGLLGQKLVRWALERGELPARIEPRTPLSIAAQRIAWAPSRPLEVDARIAVDGGPQIGLILAWQPDLLELKRLSIKDAHSDAALTARIAADRINASFSGRLEGRSIAALLRQPPPSDSGTAHGDLRITIDRVQPARSIGEGHLQVEALDVSWLAGKRAIVERIDLTTDPNGARITDARLDWEEQRFALRGSVQRTPEGPLIDARLESPGIALERLLPPPRPRAPDEKPSTVWPLPVRGRVEVRTAFVEYQQYRVAPFDGILSVEPQRARLEVKEALMCGVSFPLEIEARPDHSTAAVHVAMKDQPIENTIRCLTGNSVEITGTADLRAELRAQGRRPHLLRDMTGTAQAELRQGQVKRFALLGNILSVRNIASAQRLREEGFAYRSMHARGRFENGEFVVDEAGFDSDAIGLAASGRVDLLGSNTQLTVLVGLLTTVDRIAGAIPIIGDIFGGSLTALPVAVNGDIRNPLVVPLGPRAVSEHLLGILGRTAKLPGKLLVPAPAP